MIKNRKIITIAAILTSLIIGGGLFCFSTYNISNAHPESSAYGMDFTSNNNKLFDGKTDDAIGGDISLKTYSGNSATFIYAGFCTKDLASWHSIYRNGFITNISSIKGITSLTINFLNEVSEGHKISIFYSCDKNFNDNQKIDYVGPLSKITCDFNDFKPFYFKFLNGNSDDSDSTIDIESMVLEFACQDYHYYVNATSQDTSIGTTTGSGWYDAGGEATVEATNGGGFLFGGWYQNDTLVSKSNPYTIKPLNAAYNLVAHWDPIDENIIYTQKLPDYFWNYIVTGLKRKDQSSYTIVNKYKGQNVVRIEDDVFSDCTNLPSIIIPDGITSIGESSFYGCTALKNITIPNSINEIGKKAFSNCISLESFTIPQSLTSIPNSMFENCSSLSNISISDNITSIGNDAFYKCSNLTKIYFQSSSDPSAKGTKAEWNAITKGTHWHYGCPKTEVICEDGSIFIEN